MRNSKIKSAIIILLSTLTINFFVPVPGNAQVLPTFEVRVDSCNLHRVPLPLDQDSILTFDIYLQHTNPGASGPFRLELNQYAFDFNPSIANGGTLEFSIVPNSSELPPDVIPFAPLVIGGSILYFPSNNQPINPPIISSVSPGTRVMTIKMQTSARLFALQALSLVIRTGPTNPFTKVFANIGGFGIDITNNGSYTVDSGFCLNQLLPVELASFTSVVSRNNITLNWTTNKEINNSGFDIERKLVLETNWTKIGNVTGNGNTNETKNYTFADRTNTGKYNYRLKQIDFNGNFSYFNLSNEVEVGIPSVYNISQNYPNPFNPTTKINYDIPKDGLVKLIIFDNNGREIKTLLNEFKQAGYYIAEFDGSNLSSGIYFYRIESGSAEGGFVATKKMVFLK